MKKILLFLFLILFSAKGFAYGSAGCDSSTDFLCHFEGVNASTTYTEEGCQGVGKKTITAQGTPGTPITTTNPKFGNSCALMDGSTQYIDTPDNDAYNFSNQRFTVDFWMNQVSTSGTQCLFGHATSGTTYAQLKYDGSTITLQVYSANTLLISVSGSTTMNAGTWYHVAMIRGWNGNIDDFAITVNGVAVATATTSNAWPDYTGTFHIGDNTVNGGLATFNGRMDEFRVSKGVARWTVNFTPPTSSYCSGCEMVGD